MNGLVGKDGDQQMAIRPTFLVVEDGPQSPF